MNVILENKKRKLKRNFVPSLHPAENHHAVVHYSTGNTNKEYFVFSLLFKVDSVDAAVNCTISVGEEIWMMELEHQKK